jgi:UDP-N-acetylmuramoyl-tripeptide--D-alanyl-D-alanine ligase
MTFWTPDTIRFACAGTWLVRPPQITLPPDRPADLPLPPLHAPITGVSTDSRSIQPGQMFIAIRGERFDGHAYLHDAARAGAPIVIIDDATKVPTAGFTPAVGVLKVADTGKALLKLAAAYRQSLARTKVIAVCGSNGKTTTTRLIHHALATAYRGTASQKSFNNEVGVPLTILSAKENDQFLICEVGTNAPGEIQTLAEVVRPDIAVITSIGREHLELLGDLAGVAKEEAVILKFLRPGGWAVINADATELFEHARGVRNVIRFGLSKDADLRITSVTHERRDTSAGVGLSVEINGRLTLKLGLIGEHNAHNALAALAVARRMGMDENKVLAALSSAPCADMRLDSSRIALPGGSALVINDAYNANPDSMLAAISTVTRVRAQLGPAIRRVVLVLGQMLELGASEASAHRELGELLADLAHRGNIDRVILVGEGTRPALASLQTSAWTAARADGDDYAVRWLAETDDAGLAALADGLLPGDLVLLKGSRRIKLERVLSAIRALADSTSPALPAGAGSAAVRGLRVEPITIRG